MIVFKNNGDIDHSICSVHTRGDIHIVSKDGNGIRLRDGYYQRYNYDNIKKLIKNDSNYVLIPKIKLISNGRKKMWKKLTDKHTNVLMLMTPNGTRSIIENKSKIKVYHSEVYGSKKEVKSVTIKSHQ